MQLTDLGIYRDIATRTGGDIYIGVVGPVRTGKSTLIKRFIQNMFLPSIENEYGRERARDEMPQSASGRTVMTTEPKFVPEEAATVEIDENTSFRMKMIDCVGYIVDGAIGHIENGEPRMVMTPWSEDPLPFEQAPESLQLLFREIPVSVSFYLSCRLPGYTGAVLYDNADSVSGGYTAQGCAVVSETGSVEVFSGRRSLV